MCYNFSEKLRRAVPTQWATAPKAIVADSQQNGPTDQPTAGDGSRGSPTGSGRLLTDGGESDSDDEDSESDGADEEMAPPEQEGEAGAEPEDEERQEAEEGEQEGQEAEEAEETEEGDEEMAPPEREGEAGEEPEAEGEEATEQEQPEVETEGEEAESEEEETVDVPQSDVESVGAEEDESTTVLFLDLYGLDLDLLGLEIQLHQLVLDVFATEGDGNLLGNLLSGVAGLGDGDLLPSGLSDMMPEDGLSGMLPGGDKIKNTLGLGGGGESEEGEGQDRKEGQEGEESGGLLSSTASSIRESVPSLPVKQLLIEVIAGVIKQLLESPEKESGEEASGEGS